MSTQRNLTDAEFTSHPISVMFDELISGVSVSSNTTVTPEPTMSVIPTYNSIVTENPNSFSIYYFIMQIIGILTDNVNLLLLTAACAVYVFLLSFSNIKHWINYCVLKILRGNVVLVDEATEESARDFSREMNTLYDDDRELPDDPTNFNKLAWKLVEEAKVCLRLIEYSDANVLSLDRWVSAKLRFRMDNGLRSQHALRIKRRVMFLFFQKTEEEKMFSAMEGSKTFKKNVETPLYFHASTWFPWFNMGVQPSRS
jgi:hypothetical protein